MTSPKHYSPEANSATIPVNTGHLPRLVAHLDLPQVALLTVHAVTVPFALDELPGLGVLDASGPSALPISPVSFPASRLPGGAGDGQGAIAPTAHPEAEHAVPALAQAWLTRLEVGEVGAGGTSEHGGHQDPADAVLEPRATSLGAGSPRCELRDHAVTWTRNDARLL